MDNAPNQPSKFRMKNWVEINDDSCGTYNANSQIEFKTSMLLSSLCDYSDAFILVKAAIKVARREADTAVRQPNERSKRSNFIDCIREINDTQIHNAKDLDVVMPI